MTISIVNKTDHIDTSNNEPSRDLLTIDRALNVSFLNVNNEKRITEQFIDNKQSSSQLLARQ